MNTLPPDSLTCITNSLSTDTNCLIAMRSTCKFLWHAIPIEKILGVNKETAKWLLQSNQPQRWLKTCMRNSTFTLCVHEKSITIYIQNDFGKVKTESHQPLGKRYAFPNIEDHRCMISLDHDNTAVCTLSLMHQLDEDEDEIVVSDAGDGVCAFCELPGVVYMATQAGVVYSLDLDQSMQEICNDFIHKRKQLKTSTAKDFKFPRILSDTIHINKMHTVDGLGFTFLINTNIIIHCNSKSEHRLIRSHNVIKDFWSINTTSILCWLDNNTLRILNLTTGHFTATVPINMSLENCVIHTTPSLECIWILDPCMRLFRYGHDNNNAQPRISTPNKSAEHYRAKSMRLMYKLKEARANNALLSTQIQTMKKRSRHDG